MLITVLQSKQEQTIFEILNTLNNFLIERNKYKLYTSLHYLSSLQAIKKIGSYTVYWQIGKFDHQHFYCCKIVVSYNSPTQKQLEMTHNAPEETEKLADPSHLCRFIVGSIKTSYITLNQTLFTRGHPNHTESTS